MEGDLGTVFLEADPGVSSSDSSSSESYHDNLPEAEAIMNLRTRQISQERSPRESASGEEARIQRIIRKSSVSSPSPPPSGRKLSASWKTEVQETRFEPDPPSTSPKLSWTSTNGTTSISRSSQPDAITQVHLPRPSRSPSSSAPSSRSQSRMETPPIISEQSPWIGGDTNLPVSKVSRGGFNQIKSNRAKSFEGDQLESESSRRSRKDKCAFSVRKRDKSWDQKWMEHLEKTSPGSVKAAWSINREPGKINPGAKWEPASLLSNEVPIRKIDPHQTARTQPITTLRFDPQSQPYASPQVQERSPDPQDSEESEPAPARMSGEEPRSESFEDVNDSDKKESSPPSTRTREYVSPGRPPMSPRSVKRRMIIRVRKSPSPASDPDCRIALPNQQAFNPQIYERYCAALDEERLKEELYLQQLQEATTQFHDNIDHIERSFEQLVQGVIQDFNESSFDGTFRAVPVQIVDHATIGSEVLLECDQPDIVDSTRHPSIPPCDYLIPDEDSQTEEDTTTDSYQVYEIDHSQAQRDHKESASQECLAQRELAKLERVVQLEEERIAQVEIQAQIHEEERRRLELQLKMESEKTRATLEEEQRRILLAKEQTRLEAERLQWQEDQRMLHEDQRRRDEEQRKRMESDLKRRELEAMERKRWETEQATLKDMAQEQREQDERHATRDGDKEQMILTKQLRSQPNGMNRKANPGPGHHFPTFQTDCKPRMFTVSGMWNNVDLGIVQEKKSFWMDQSDDVDTLNQTAQRSSASRTINPNKWMDDPKSPVRTGNRPLSIHKSLSNGNIAQECEDEIHKTLSSGVGAWEQRETGRKSADIFMHYETRAANPSPVGLKAIIPAVTVDTPNTPDNRAFFERQDLWEQPEQRKGDSDEEQRVIHQGASAANNLGQNVVKNALIRPIATQNQAHPGANLKLAHPPPHHHHDPWLSKSQEYLPPNNSYGSLLEGNHSLSLLSVNLSPGSSVADLSSGRSSPTGRSGHSSYFKKGRKRRKSSKIAHDIARRAEEFAQSEKERMKRESLAKARQEQFIQERRGNEPNIIEASLKKKILHPNLQAPALDIGAPNQQPDVDSDLTESERFQRWQQVQADLARQKLEEEVRLKQIEADRVRQVEEDERLQSIPTNRDQLSLAQVIQNKQRQIANSPASRPSQEEQQHTPEELKARIAQKLEDKRKKESRKHYQHLKNVGQHQSPTPNASSSTSSLKPPYVTSRPTERMFNNTNNEATSNTDMGNEGSEDSGAAPTEKPVPPQRDRTSEAKSISQMAKTTKGAYPSQQDRWAMKRADEERRRKEWEELKRLEEEQQEIFMRVEEKQLHHESLSRQESEVVEKGIDALIEREMAVSPISSDHEKTGRRMSSLSMDEDKRLAEWEELKRKESEAEEMRLRELEKQMHQQKSVDAEGRRRKSHSFDPVEELPLPPPPPLPRNPPRPPLPKQLSTGEQLQDWELLKRQEEEAQERMMRELERQNNPKSVTPNVPPKKKSPPKPLDIRDISADVQAPPVRQASQPETRIPVQEPLCVEVKAYQTTTASPNPAVISPCPIQTSQEEMLRQQREWENIQRRQDEDEERMRLEVERELLKERNQVHEERQAKLANEEHSFEKTWQNMKENTIEEADEEEPEEASEDQSKLLEIKKRKEAVETELAKEKAHLEELKNLERQAQSPQLKRPKPKAAEQYEKMVGGGGESAEPVRTVADPSPASNVQDQQRKQELEKIKQLKQLEWQKLRELEAIKQQRCNPKALVAPSSKNAESAVGHSTSLEDHRISSCSEDEMYLGVSETSLGMENDPISSGNVTPIPTTGELEAIRVQSESRPPHLKSLLKKPSFDEDDGDVDTLGLEGAKARAVQFSDVNQVKVLTPCTSSSSVVKDHI